MSHEEISNILKTSYGEDLGYDSDDAEYEYYSKFKCTSENLSGFLSAFSVFYRSFNLYWI
jgi:hypothetical protein